MKLVQSRYSSGRRVPVLVQDDPVAPLPSLIPFIYTHLKLKHLAYGTAAAHLRAIQSFYIYADTRGLCLDEAIINCRFEAILGLLDGYTIWIQSRRQTHNLIGYIRSAPTVHAPLLDLRTRDQYLRLLKKFVSWCATRYIPQARNSSALLPVIDATFANVADSIERRFDSHVTNVRSNRVRYRSLTEEQIQIIRAFIRPGTTENPYPKHLQLRNWLIIELLIETGMRRGELLKLQTRDINRGAKNDYVSITNREHDPADPRAAEPALKTNGRVVGISSQLYEVYEQYIQSERHPVRLGKRIKLSSLYLFISDRGKPLSITSLSNVIDRLFLSIGYAHPGILPTLSTHDFRHTFADNFLAHLVDNLKYDLERGMDELRKICGWTDSSAMPHRYAARYLADSANTHNAQRNTAAWSRVNGEDIRYE